MAKKALIIIDMLNDFVLKGAPLKVPKIETITGPIQREIEKAKLKNFPVIYLCDSHRPDDPEFKRFAPHAVKNTEGAKVIGQLKPQGSDIIVKKTTFSGFYKTELERVLNMMGVNHLRVTGCVTNICVYLVVFEAISRGYEVDVVSDAVIGLNQRDHRFALRQMKDVLKANVI
ncbi:MAG: cysteine hydrolase [Actinomycetia bacterium]|nr:cysteine hydrolase [Actinomycetes bacterium]